MILFNLGAGSFSNLGNSNWMGTFLSYISPMRYASELLLRRLLSEKFYQDYVYEFFHYEYGVATCYSVLAGFAVFYFLLGWLILLIKTRWFL